ncbi:MAG: HxsD-like protein [Candidatus Omnitrophota bacterium]|jgi:hypothetical protein
MLAINFDGSIYNIKAVKKAISDYRGLADFSWKEKKGCIAVGIDNIRDKELKALFVREFSNYVLSLVGALK